MAYLQVLEIQSSFQKMSLSKLDKGKEMISSLFIIFERGRIFQSPVDK